MADTVVLIHPAGASSAFWEPQRAALARRYRVRVPDLPGRDGDRFTLDAAVARVRAELEDAPGCLVALSLGVTVALRVAVEAPDRVTGLVLSGGMAKAPALLGVQRGVMALLPARVLSAINARAVPPGYRERAVADHARVGRANLRAELRELARTDLRRRMADVTAPTLVLCGEKDRANLPGCRALAAGIPGADLVVVPGAGHLWNWERPDLFTSTVTGFVDRCVAAS